MAWKNLVSTDPRKKRAVGALRNKAGIYKAKVTNVKIDGSKIKGDVMAYIDPINGYKRLGTFETIIKDYYEFRDDVEDSVVGNWIWDNDTDLYEDIIDRMWNDYQMGEYHGNG